MWIVKCVHLVWLIVLWVVYAFLFSVYNCGFSIWCWVLLELSIYLCVVVLLVRFSLVLFGGWGSGLVAMLLPLT